MGNNAKERKWKHEKSIMRDGDSILKDAKETDIIIPVMGPTGVGKSTFINTLLGENIMPVGHHLKSSTNLAYREINPIPGRPPSLKGRRLILVDTPGFDDTHEEDAEILRRISVGMASFYAKGAKLGGIIYLHDIENKRMTGVARMNLEIFRHLCGDKSLRRVVLGTTKWRDVDKGGGQQRQKGLVQEYWADLINNGSVVRQFDGTQRSAQAILGTILDNINRVASDRPLQIQRELVDHSRLICQTAAGEYLRHFLEEMIEMLKQSIKLERKQQTPDSDLYVHETAARLKKLQLQVNMLQTPRMVILLSISGIGLLSLPDIDWLSSEYDSNNLRQLEQALAQTITVLKFAGPVTGIPSLPGVSGGVGVALAVVEIFEAMTKTNRELIELGRKVDQIISDTQAEVDQRGISEDMQAAANELSKELSRVQAIVPTIKSRPFLSRIRSQRADDQQISDCKDDIQAAFHKFIYGAVFRHDRELTRQRKAIADLEKQVADLRLGIGARLYKQLEAYTYT